MAWTGSVTVTPTIAASAFSANDIVGGKLTLLKAVPVSEGRAFLDSLVLLDAAKEEVDLDIYIFGEDLAGTYADNSAEAITLADLLKCVGIIEVKAADYKTLANASLISFGNMGIRLKAGTGTNLYALIVTLGTPTYTEDCLQLKFGIRRE